MRVGSTSWTVVACAAVAMLAELLGIAVEAAAPAVVPNCTVSSFPTAADVRSTDTTADFAIVITGDRLVSDSGQIASALQNLNSSLVSTYGLIVFSKLGYYNKQAPDEVDIRIKQNSNYVINSNDTVTISFPSQLFANGVACRNVIFNVTPSPGTIDSTLIPTTIFEITINTQNVVFDIPVVSDQFLSSDLIVSPSPLYGNLVMTLRLLNPFVIRATIRKNESFNILSTAVLPISIFFPQNVTQTGLSPLVTASSTTLVVNIAGSQAFVVTKYTPVAEASVPAEQMWDGIGTTTLQLYGDEWQPDPTLWNNSLTAPVYSVVPEQSFGFSFLQRSNVSLFVQLAPRLAVMAWAPCVGFSLSTTQTVTLSQWGTLTNEGLGAVPISFNIRPVTPAAIETSWNIVPSITEADIRRSGFHFSLTLSHDIISPSITADDIMTMFSSTSLTLDSLSFSVTNLTVLDVTVPPQLGFNLDQNVTLALQVTPSILASHNSVALATSVNITSVETPRCNLASGTSITEANVRRVSNLTFFIIFSQDLCFNASDPAVQASIIGRISTTNSLLRFALNTNLTTNRTIAITIIQNPFYNITQVDFVAVTLGAGLLCSLEPCVPDIGAKGTITLPVKLSPGVLTSPNMPSIINETLLVRTGFNVTMLLAGDTFVDSQFQPLFQIVTSDKSRGFAASIQPGCSAVRDVANVSIAYVTCLPNATYDISAVENVTMFVDGKLVAKGTSPTNLLNTLIISPVPGIIVSSFNDSSAELNESSIIAGGVTMTLTAVYDRWNLTVIKGIIQRTLVDTSSKLSNTHGFLAMITTILSDSAFSVNRLMNQLTITFQPCPAYDIPSLETFYFVVQPQMLYSGLTPVNANNSFAIFPVVGSVVATGNALFVGVSDILQSSLTLTLTLSNDLWDPNAPYSNADLCPLSSCIISIDSATQRILTAVMEPNVNYYTFSNISYPVLLKGAYVVSGTQPTANVSIQVFLTSGSMTITGPSTVTEDDVRAGSVPPFFLTIDGDLFRNPQMVRQSLLESIQCDGDNDPADVFAFCGRLKGLLGGAADTAISVLQQSRVVFLSLQADRLFDVYASQTVTIRVNSKAVVSGLPPSATYTFTVNPTVGVFFVSGMPLVVSSRMLSGADTSISLKIVLSLRGERFLPNASLAAQMVTQYLSSDVPPSMQRGWMYFRSILIDPDSATLSDDCRVLTLVVTPTGLFTIQRDEHILIVVGRDAVLSHLAPSGGTVRSNFTVVALGGLINLNPAYVPASQMRLLGVNVTLTVIGDKWRQSYVQVPKNVISALSSSSPMIVEPTGFISQISTMVQHIVKNAVNINGTVLTIRLLPAGSYDVLAPEQVTITLAPNWTTSGLPMSPYTFSFTVLPDFPSVECVVFQSGPVNVQSFVQALSRWMSVPVPFVNISFVGPEVNLPNETYYQKMYHRVSFRFLTGAAVPPYSNALASAFVSISPTLLRREFNTTIAFFNVAPPSQDFWNALVLQSTSTSSFLSSNLSSNLLIIFGGVVALLIAAVVVYRRLNKPTMVGGMKRVTKLRGVQKEAEVDADATLFVGQRKAEVGLMGSPTTQKDPQSPSAKDAGPEVPVTLYSGQRSAPPKVLIREEQLQIAELQRAAWENEKELRSDNRYGVSYDHTVYPAHSTARLIRKSHFDMK